MVGLVCREWSKVERGVDPILVEVWLYVSGGSLFSFHVVLAVVVVVVVVVSGLCFGLILRWCCLDFDLSVVPPPPAVVPVLPPPRRFHREG